MDINFQKIKENEGKITNLNNKTFSIQFQGEITEYANNFLFLIYQSCKTILKIDIINGDIKK